MGVGVVGGAVLNYFRLEGIKPLLYDPGKGLGSVQEINQADIVFMCVPTPYVAGHGFDDSCLADAFSKLSGEKTVVIKSTVLPGTTQRYQDMYPNFRVMFNPEFLTEKNANDDFLTPDRQIVGFCDSADAGIAASVLEMLPPAPYEALLPASATEMIKYATNSFLALKVIFGNEMFDLCRALGIDYEEVRKGISVDKRIGDSHFKVMDAGYRGYGGKCLPKDTMSLLDLADDVGVTMRLLEAAHEVNQRLRAPVPFGRRPLAGEEAVEAAAVRMAG
jgi:UDPglucose 6-dehydrogenase